MGGYQKKIKQHVAIKNDTAIKCHEGSFSFCCCQPFRHSRLLLTCYNLTMEVIYLHEEREHRNIKETQELLEALNFYQLYTTHTHKDYQNATAREHNSEMIEKFDFYEPCGRPCKGKERNFMLLTQQSCCFSQIEGNISGTLVTRDGSKSAQ